MAEPVEATDLPMPDTQSSYSESYAADPGSFSNVPQESLTSVLGVVYVHRRTHDGGDLYLTRFGMKHEDLLDPHYWYERRWFERYRERLEGTSAVYRVPTKVRKGRSLELVVKNCRVGEDVPVATRTLEEFMNAEFNSPWEEFALVMELRESKYGPAEVAIRTQEPLAIYVPPERMQVWQSGRSAAKINRIKARHPGIEIDILRQYKLIYRWIRGMNAIEALLKAGIPQDALMTALEPITRKAIGDMAKKGFAVADMKPEHVIIGEDCVAALGALQKTEEKGALVIGLVEHGDYSVIDYELLLRTAEYDEQVRYSRRHSYLDDQRDRMKATPIPSHLRSGEIMGVPYVWGHAESTGGQLWVVGRNARLFDYFLPERWRRTHSWKLSENSEVYYTVTKDNVHIVWKTSRVGEKPDRGSEDARVEEIRRRGYNSPFEEVAIAQDLAAHGVPTVYMRAIYMTGTERMESSRDSRRYRSHRKFLNPDGKRVLRRDHDYITIRGYFNGPDQWVAQQKGQLCRPMDLQNAVRQGVIDQTLHDRLLEKTLRAIGAAGYDGTLLRDNDLILAIDPSGQVLKGPNNEVEARVCNFELINKLK